MARIYEQAERFKADVEARETQALITLTKQYVETLERLVSQVYALANEVSSQEGPLTNGQITRLTRYQQLIGQIETELANLGVRSSIVTGYLQRDLAAQGAENALALIDASLRGENTGLRDFAQSFNRLPSDVIEAFSGMAGNGSPLRSLFEEHAKATANRQVQTLLTNLALGKSPNVTARQFRDEFGYSLDRALRISRTESLRAYREASRQTYKQNSHIVSGYVRLASKSARTCLACLLKDGSFYTLDTPLDEHVNGRCALVPVTRYFKPTQTGLDWFSNQDEETQRAILGDKRFSQFQDGADLNSFIKLHKSNAWGNSWIMA